MPQRTYFFLFFLVVLSSLGMAEVASSPGARVREYLIGWSKWGGELRWQSEIAPEYLHPGNNDTGIASGGADFVPRLPFIKGDIITTEIAVVSETVGRSRYQLKGKQEVCYVKVRYTVVAAPVDGEMRIFSPPRFDEQYIVMAQDQKDGKWKFLERDPYQAFYYLLPDAVRRWRTIFQGQTLKNLAEVRLALEAMAEKKN